jgi:hypothetical protein
MDEAIDEGDDAGSVGEDFMPFAKDPVSGDDRVPFLIAATDELEQEVGMTIGVGEIADLIDDQESRACIVAHPPAKRGIAIECSEITE